MSKENILVIENQVTQFEQIASNLIGYNALPIDDDYTRVTDWVRIWVNKERYRKDKRSEKVLDLLANYIIANNTQIIIVDHQLSGCCKGFTGIQLALAIKKEIGGRLPISFIFLSRTPRHTKEVKEYENVFENFTWIEKGYAGLSLFEEGYFRKFVIGAVEKLVDANKNARKPHHEIIDALLSKGELEDYRDILRSLNGLEDVSEDILKELAKLKNPYLYDDEIKDIFTVIKKMMKK